MVLSRDISIKVVHATLMKTVEMCSYTRKNRLLGAIKLSWEKGLRISRETSFNRFCRPKGDRDKPLAFSPVMFLAQTVSTKSLERLESTADTTPACGSSSDLHAYESGGQVYTLSSMSEGSRRSQNLGYSRGQQKKEPAGSVLNTPQRQGASMSGRHSVWYGGGNIGFGGVVNDYHRK
ncbi:hypothetical protein ASPBRDRAFT_35405 [Aspergillus brasiliensis CBS 101740]|uniref:Uncharacterized protein n=1 Tax=Aspergillus brasiliensis (strain CBS 101740 / IMI 381727 / IBT 21946) TaxID=767769 RepID=A0A1L9U3G7_ASPBC|nr:hypothetical protein ASPBRDRAFT_35405 [Aspergillus brasiliensis CBS 101740]